MEKEKSQVITSNDAKEKNSTSITDLLKSQFPVKYMCILFKRIARNF